MQLLGRRILVKPVEPENQTSTGIFIPDSLKQQRNRGTITHVGTDVDKELIGKDILFQIEASQPFNFGETQGRLIFVSDITAIL